ncbi:conserved hypothetical protein [Candidatus Sulfopaludibacter sp. SbA3]|nr:conserved hypothetical protein [Candidatus Sulfopaludibacter sp. SbA3]
MPLNCWEFKKCGRQPGGDRVADLGVCLAASHAKAGGLNGGTRGGRICWAVSGTLCGGKAQGTFAQKLPTCLVCEFYRLVRAEQGEHLQSLKELHQRY